MPERMWRRGPDGEIVRTEPREESPPAPDEEPPGGAGRPLPRPRLTLALRLGVRDAYDYLGTVLLQSFLWSAALGFGSLGAVALGLQLFRGLPGPLSLASTVLLATLAAVLIGGPLAAGIFRFCRNAAARSEPELFDLAWGVRHAAGRSLALAGLQAGAALLLAGNAAFYLSSRHPVVLVIGALFAYLLVFWLLMACYAWPLLAEQEISTRAILKKSALLVLDNLVYTLLLGVLLLVFTAVCWGTFIVGVLLWAGVSAMVLTQAMRELLRRYGVLPPDPTLDPMADETHELRGHGRHE
ncbi:MAG: hypothetical protein ACK47B_23125 [Armatimonadota bacterium]